MNMAILSKKKRLVCALSTFLAVPSLSHYARDDVTLRQVFMVPIRFFSPPGDERNLPFYVPISYTSLKWVAAVLLQENTYDAFSGRFSLAVETFSRTADFRAYFIFECFVDVL